MPSSKDPIINRQKANEYRLAHPEWHRKANREWSAKKRASDPAFVERERLGAQRRRERYTEEEKAARAVYQKAWVAAHPEYNQQKLAASYQANPARHMFWRAKSRANELGVAFSIEIDEVAIPEVCPVLGTPLRPTGRAEARGASPSIDRLLPSLGYVSGNVRVISQAANCIKGNRTIDEMRAKAAFLRKQLAGVEAVVAYLERELG